MNPFPRGSRPYHDARASLHVAPLTNVHVPLHVPCCSSDRHARPSACSIRLVCRITLHCSSDKHARPSVCPIRSACRILLRCSTDKHACPSACPIRSACRISLHHSSDKRACPSACAVRSACHISLGRSADWHSRHLRFLAADLHFFSF
jgi:hypothetical protein